MSALKPLDFVIKKQNLRIDGNPDAEQTLVFAHGFGTDQTSWRFVIEHFKADYRLILYDNVGGGESDLRAFSPMKYYDLDAYATDLLDIAETLQLKGAVLIAHSVSSMIGILASIRNPFVFSRLILIGASPRYLNDTDYTGGFTREDLEVLYRSMRTNYFSWVNGFSAAAMRNYEQPELGQEIAGTLAAIQPDIALAVAAVIFESDCRAELEKLDNEVLIIQMKDDIAVPESVGRYLRDHISKSTLLEIDVEGHFPQLSAPEELTQAIRSFIVR